jgi:hypothetical protein
VQTKIYGLKILICIVISLPLVFSACSGGSDGSGGADNDGDLDNSGPQAIAVWAYPDGVSIPYRDDDNNVVAGDVHIGVVAYHSTGIAHVEFAVNNVTTYVPSETINPETGEYEFVLTLDPASLADDGEYSISAVAHPNDGTSTTLPILKIWKDTASHNVWYVGGAGYSTIDAACQAASGGDIIKVGSGTYDLPDQTGYNFLKYVTIMPDASASVVINSGSLRSSYLKFDRITFDLSSSLTDAVISSQFTHFWFDECTAIGFGKDDPNNTAAAFRFYDSSEYVVIENSTIHDSSLGARLSAGNYIFRNNHVHDITADGVGYDGHNILISNNLIHDNIVPAGGDQHCDFISSNTSGDQIVLRNNTCYNGSHQGIKLGAHTPGLDKPYSNVAIVNNLIAKVVDSAVNIQFLNTGHRYNNVLLEHNTFWNGSNVFLVRDNAFLEDIFVRNNIFGPNVVSSYNLPELYMDYNCLNDGVVSGSHSVIGDPQFINEGNWEFDLETTSPAKARGYSFSNIAYDINWDPRDTATPTIGAYE